MQNITLDSIITTLGNIVANFGMKILAAVAIWVIGFWIVKKLVASISYGMKIHNVEPSLASFSLSFLSITLKIFVVIIVLTTMGVQMTSIVAVLGAASLAVGMALSGTLQNVAGGMIILLFKPFKVGDTIITADGKTGIVKKIMIFTTQIHTFDNQVLFLPNGALSNGIITNLSMGEKRRTDLNVGISYGDDVEKARKLCMKILSKDKRVLKDPAPVILLNSLDDSAVTLTIRYWTKWQDLFSAKADILETIYKEFPKNKLNFPFPQIDVHVKKK
ncbi:MAG: mechanosensitive ion channel [Alphaproteobacteria bacterium]|nr:mechanosensitive ion channel [Alphaproteobacteria bacterium]